MARGGYRAGGGRPPGIKETKPRARRKTKAIEVHKQPELTPEQKRLLQSFLARIEDGGTLTRTEKPILDGMWALMAPEIEKFRMNED